MPRRGTQTPSGARDLLLQETRRRRRQEHIRANAKRRMIALAIEKTLWNGPHVRTSEQDLSLDDFAEQYQVSRRTIQLAVQENFGMGFTALRRTIRLHQVRRAMNELPHKNVSELAMEFFFNHLGRFSREYFEAFGVLPSNEIRKSPNKPF